MSNDLLKRYGVTEAVSNEANLYPDLVLARISSQHKDIYKVITLQGEVFAEISGKFRYAVTQLSDYPAVGTFNR